MKLLPSSLFGRAVLTLVVAFSLFALLTLGAVVYYTLIPVAHRSADDLASFMVWSAQAWAMMPPAQRAGYREKLLQEHRIRVGEPDGKIPEGAYFLPYVRRVEKALENRLGFRVPVQTRIEDGRRWFLMDLNVSGQPIRVGFPRDRIATRPLTGLIVLALFSVSLVLVTAGILARRITAPLTRLSQAAVLMATGGSPEPLPERGPRELKQLAREFNRMARQVSELLGNRTTLLAGISHDLRTPITRLHLALAMLPDETDPTLVRRMERDLEQMNDLIGQAMELSRNLGHGEASPVDLSTMLEQLVEGRPRVHLQTPGACTVQVNGLALRRVLDNLINNAVRYGKGRRVVVRLLRDREPIEIEVMDRGPGIPDDLKEAVFRPFFRMEQSRSRRTGGSGLGLAVARQLADANGMAIRLDNREGGGTVARVVLPQQKEQDTRASQPPNS
jgi:two-component system osmolarity sensor histidine kinase EnvZ